MQFLIRSWWLELHGDYFNNDRTKSSSLSPSVHAPRYQNLQKQTEIILVLLQVDSVHRSTQVFNYWMLLKTPSPLSLVKAIELSVKRSSVPAVHSDDDLCSSLQQFNNCYRVNPEPQPDTTTIKHKENISTFQVLDEYFVFTV